jgi:formylmethanofuran dehydrogenase subunit E
MDRAEALRSIRYDLLEYIQKRVSVDFDNVMQMPVCFTFYFSCCKCEQQVLRSRTIDFRGKIYCVPCFQRMNTGWMHYSIQ